MNHEKKKNNLKEIANCFITKLLLQCWSSANNSICWWWNYYFYYKRSYTLCIKKQILPFLGYLSWELNYVFLDHKLYLESTMDFSTASLFCIHSSSSDAGWQNGMCIGYWNDREGILPKLSFSFLFSNIVCILALSRKVVSTVRQTEHFSFFLSKKVPAICVVLSITSFAH